MEDIFKTDEATGLPVSIETLQSSTETVTEQPAVSSTSPPKKKSKKDKKRQKLVCQYYHPITLVKCRKTEDDCVIKNKSCPEHRADMAKRTNAIRNEAYHNSYLKLNSLPSDGIGLPTLKKCRKVILWYEQVYSSAMSVRAVCLQQTYGIGLYQQLKNNGIAMLETGMFRSEEECTTLRQAMKQLPYEQLFTSFGRKNSKVMIDDGKPNRWHSTGDEVQSLCTNAVNLRTQLQCQLNTGRFPRGSAPSKIKFSILKNDRGLTTPQDVHCDSMQAWGYDKSDKFNISVLIGFEKHSFLDVMSKDGSPPYRFCIERGDMLFLRGDIPHRGCETTCDHDHYRIHAYLDPSYKASESKKKTDYDQTVKTKIDFGHQPYYSPETNMWINFLKK